MRTVLTIAKEAVKALEEAEATFKQELKERGIEL